MINKFGGVLVTNVLLGLYAPVFENVIKELGYA
jgi:hypothetical protein